jgi:CRP-like cAMP-binding protein
MAEVRYSEGNILFAEGDYSDHVVRIIEGEVEVLKQVKDQLVTLGRVGEGEFVGEMGVLEGRPRSATVRATSAVVAEQMDRNTFLRLISADGATAFNLLVRLSERLAATDQAYARAVIKRCRREGTRPSTARRRSRCLRGRRGWPTSCPSRESQSPGFRSWSDAR